MKITKTRLMYLFSLALPGFASVWLTAGFSVAPTADGMLIVVAGAVATAVLVNTWLTAAANGSVGGWLHQAQVAPRRVCQRQPFLRGR